MSAAACVPIPDQVWGETASKIPPFDTFNWPPNAVNWHPNAFEWQPGAFEWQPGTFEWQPGAFEWPPDAFERQPDTFEWPPNPNVWLMLHMLMQENIRLKAKNADLSNRCQELKAENQKLYERLHLGSDTSSIPSSKGWKGNNIPKETGETVDPDAGQGGNGTNETPISVSGYINGKTGGKRPPGGQKNHAPAFMHIDDVREGEPVLHYPEKCAGCPRIDQCIEEGRFQKRTTTHGYDIEVIRIHRVHILFEATECANNGGQVKGDFPGVIGTQYYEMNVQLHIITWHHIFHGSYDRIGLAAKELLGLSLSAGTANAIVQRVSAKILGSGFMDAIRFYILLFEMVLGVDETSACVNGMNAWVHTAVTANVTLLTAHWCRGYEGIIYAGVLQFYIQTIISDCWVPYFNEHFKFKHALCDGHILRELVAAAYFRQQGWAIEMFDLLLETLNKKRGAVAQGEKGLPQEYIEDVRTRYQRIVADGFNENAGATKGKTLSLLERLRNLEDAVLAFAVDFNVDFTNNASEQSLRNLKVALRVMGQFKTMPGLADYCIIQSFMDTCRKQGHNPFDMLRILLSGGDIIEAVFGPEKAVPIKQMIKLTDIIATGDSIEIEDAMAEIPLSLTEELSAAASYGRLKVYDGPPPEKKNSSSTVPKDKMQAAREANLHKNLDDAAPTPANMPQHNSEDSTKITKHKKRAGPKYA